MCVQLHVRLCFDRMSFSRLSHPFLVHPALFLSWTTSHVPKLALPPPLSFFPYLLFAIVPIWSVAQLFCFYTYQSFDARIDKNWNVALDGHWCSNVFDLPSSHLSQLWIYVVFVYGIRLCACVRRVCFHLIHLMPVDVVCVVDVVLGTFVSFSVLCFEQLFFPGYRF